jgi:predicted Rossmann fold flavoprotein
MKSQALVASLTGEVVIMLLVLLLLGNVAFPNATIQTVQALSLGWNPQQKKPIRIGILGGGAAGMFAACIASETVQKYFDESRRKHNSSFVTPPVHIVVMEATKQLMAKVKISGGGRCNVLHDTTKPTRELLDCYPRGRKEISGIFCKSFTPSMAREWFESKGVRLKVEKDGRMFPTTDTSQTIIDAIEHSALQGGLVQIRRRFNVQTASTTSDGKFSITYSNRVDKNEASQQPFDEQEESFDTVVIATGSFPAGHKICSNLGHSIVKPVPSLFTLSMANDVKDGGLLYNLAGLSVKNVRISFKVSRDDMLQGTIAAPTKNLSSSYQKKHNQKQIHYVQDGPVLITHEGISGPAPLKLSAFAAREFHAVKYRGQVQINFAPDVKDVESSLLEHKLASPRKLISSGCPLILREVDYEKYNWETDSFQTVETTLIPKRLWNSMCRLCGISDSARWSDASKTTVRALAKIIESCTLEVTGKSVNKEEFVTAGGVNLKEIDMSTMQSKKVNGLFFCGEVIDVDGITGMIRFS